MSFNHTYWYDLSFLFFFTRWILLLLCLMEGEPMAVTLLCMCPWVQSKSIQPVSCSSFKETTVRSSRSMTTSCQLSSDLDIYCYISLYMYQIYIWLCMYIYVYSSVSEHADVCCSEACQAKARSSSPHWVMRSDKVVWL